MNSRSMVPCTELLNEKFYNLDWNFRANLLHVLLIMYLFHLSNLKAIFLKKYIDTKLSHLLGWKISLST